MVRPPTHAERRRHGSTARNVAVGRTTADRRPTRIEARWSVGRTTARNVRRQSRNGYEDNS